MGNFKNKLHQTVGFSRELEEPQDTYICIYVCMPYLERAGE